MDVAFQAHIRPTPHQEQRLHYRVTTEADGDFTLTEVPAGTYRLYASPTDLPGRWQPPPEPALRRAHFLLTDPFPVEAEQTVEQKLTLGRAGTIRGVVREADRQEPLAGAHVEILRPALGRLLFGEWGKAATTEASGQFEIPCLPPGDYELSVSHAGCVTARRSFALTAGQTQEIQVELPVNDWGSPGLPGIRLVP